MLLKQIMMFVVLGICFKLVINMVFCLGTAIANTVGLAKGEAIFDEPTDFRPNAHLSDSAWYKRNILFCVRDFMLSGCAIVALWMFLKAII